MPARGWRPLFPRHGAHLHGLVGLPYSMAAGFQGPESQEEAVAVVWPGFLILQSQSPCLCSWGEAVDPSSL